LDYLDDDHEVVSVEFSRAHMKKLVRKQAKLQLRARRKAEKVIPHCTKMITDMASMIEMRLTA